MTTLKKIQFYPGDVPSKPGVYIFRDRFGTVIYVGKAANLRRRVSQYFQPSRETRADAKLRSMINSIETWECIPVHSEDESLILESRLIKEYAPRYNVLLRDDKRHFLIRIDMAEKFPRLRLARLRKDDSSLYFGPFPKGGALKQTVEFLTHHFGLRSCKPACPDESDKAHCMAAIVRDCCKPCVGAVTEEEYMEKVRALVSVLEGSVKPVTELLREKMMDSASKRSFEKAALYRDIANNIESLYGAKTRTFANASIPSAPGTEAVSDLKNALKLKTDPSHIIAFDISNISGTLAVASMVSFKDGRPDKASYKRFRIKTVVGANDFAMMSEAVQRHFSRLIDEKRQLPDILLVDGGKGQLSSAIDALVKVRCPAFPVIGLAKKNEEIFIPGSSDPVVLDRGRPALKLLQAIRDEAHRFAITYHRALRLRRIQDSILDEIQGIGENRKKALLSEFGSVHRLRNATPEEIARRVSGIGLEFAKTICDYLASHSPVGQSDIL